MDIIDFHTHFFPESLFRAIWRFFDSFSWKIEHKVFADELLLKLKALGVSKMVLLNYAHKPGMSQSLNQWTHEFAANNPEIIPFGTVHPHDVNLSEMIDECFDEFGFFGLKLHSHVLNLALDDPMFFPIYEKIESAGKILMLHGGNGPGYARTNPKTSHVSGVERVKVIIKNFPKMKLVIPHLGVNQPDEFFDLMEDHENLWMDTTMVLADYFPLKPSLTRIEQLSDRILYGSDSPNIPYPLEIEMNNIKNWFSEAIQEKLFFKNAQRLLGLEG